ncbi:MAG: hypothetical protein IPJ88_12810 [Myxococcales bacterium]|nr:MAG: hypothetical protein IPJ88_12810 [Myxococcales bacterium]
MATDSYMINLKFFIENDDSLDHENFIRVFHEWIKQGSLDDVLIDVADYRHVHHGPGVMLIAHYANLGLDQQDGKTGLLYHAKRDVAGSLSEQLHRAFAYTLKAAEQLETESCFNGQLKFQSDSFLLRVHNRLQIGTETEKAQDQLNEALKDVFPALDWTLDRTRQEKGPLAFTASNAPSTDSVKKLLEHLSP